MPHVSPHINSTCIPQNHCGTVGLSTVEKPPKGSLIETQGARQGVLDSTRKASPLPHRLTPDGGAMRQRGWKPCLALTLAPVVER